MSEPGKSCEKLPGRHWGFHFSAVRERGKRKSAPQPTTALVREGVMANGEGEWSHPFTGCFDAIAKPSENSSVVTRTELQEALARTKHALPCSRNTLPTAIVVAEQKDFDK